MPTVAVAASVAVLVGLSGLAVTQGVRLSDARQQTLLLSDAVNFAAQPGAKQVPLADRTGAPGPVTAMAHPGIEECYIVARDLPTPPAGTKYGVWVTKGSSAQLIGHFVPREPVTVLKFGVDPSEYDQILVTEDPPGSVSHGNVLWTGSV
jgi:Anti-sigma-K factor rskA